MKYCIFGGSFDPPHEGHRHLAESAASALQLDKILWVPAQDPPHKSKPGTPFEHRLAMVRLAVAGMPGNAVSDVEAQLSSPSYSLNTIKALKHENGAGHEWFFLIGSDNWAIFPTWHRWQDVLREVTMLVYPRQGHAMGSKIPHGVQELQMSPVAGESRLIRETLEKTGDMEAAGVLLEIRAYIAKHGLYGIGSPGAA
ncbi:MAG TPA: nicotinate (nicotinamide) nucleotide adenylyltransferase [Fibrobacteria bacterium]|nr:nicotinate (nicotinamide) nucleotide adenylyltransferase [Fibrobacteria bacterium]